MNRENISVLLMSSYYYMYIDFIFINKKIQDLVFVKCNHNKAMFPLTKIVIFLYVVYIAGFTIVDIFGLLFF